MLTYTLDLEERIFDVSKDNVRAMNGPLKGMLLAEFRGSREHNYFFSLTLLQRLDSFRKAIKT